jgi:leucyl-tRNA synthetase
VWERPWPEADPSLLVTAEIEVVVQVNGKLRDRINAPADANEEQLEGLARESAKVQLQLDGQAVVKVVVVPGKLVNFVVK